MLENSERELTFRMQTRPGYDSDFTLNESDYTVAIDDGTTRYTSKKSGIVVEVNGRSVTIQSTVGKQSRGRNEELAPVVPPVD
ncbi:hypothetical protein AAVH_31440 [Aphelenchoides avenae]|nr:hypothetical protein AAVH_31440 [Aphelenchus avenae]